MARAPTPPRQKPSDWLTRVTPARRNNLSASLHRIVFVLTRSFLERLKNANLSFRKQLKNNLKATRAGQTWSGVEKKRHHYTGGTVYNYNTNVTLSLQFWLIDCFPLGRSKTWNWWLVFVRYTLCLHCDQHTQCHPFHYTLIVTATTVVLVSNLGHSNNSKVHLDNALKGQVLHLWHGWKNTETLSKPCVRSCSAIFKELFASQCT